MRPVIWRASRNETVKDAKQPAVACSQLEPKSQASHRWPTLHIIQELACEDESEFRVSRPAPPTKLKSTTGPRQRNQALEKSLLKLAAGKVQQAWPSCGCFEPAEHFLDRDDC